MDSFKTQADEQTIPVLEEVATVSRRTVTTGVTTVEKQVHTQGYLVSDTLQTHGASVERIAVGTEVDAACPPRTRTENGVTIIPVLEEILVVEKRLVLKEELHIRHHVEEVTARQTVTLQSEEVVLSHRKATDADPRGDAERSSHATCSPSSTERES